VALASAAGAAEYTLRIQTHHSPETLPGKIFLQFVQEMETNSGGRIEEFMSSSVVKSVETFGAASTVVLDGDMTGAAYQTARTRRSNSSATSWAATSIPTRCATG
jgi:TRAP-type C4-dicarboxylate transport system substrate-binding protein